MIATEFATTVLCWKKIWNMGGKTKQQPYNKTHNVFMGFSWIVTASLMSLSYMLISLKRTAELINLKSCNWEVWPNVSHHTEWKKICSSSKKACFRYERIPILSDGPLLNSINNYLEGANLLLPVQTN